MFPKEISLPVNQLLQHKPRCCLRQCKNSFPQPFSTGQPIRERGLDDVPLRSPGCVRRPCRAVGDSGGADRGPAAPSLSSLLWPVMVRWLLLVWEFISIHPQWACSILSKRKLTLGPRAREGDRRNSSNDHQLLWSTNGLPFKQPRYQDYLIVVGRKQTLEQLLKALKAFSFFIKSDNSDWAGAFCNRQADPSYTNKRTYNHLLQSLANRGHLLNCG